MSQLSLDVLATAGYDVEAVKDGVAGWEALQNRRYDLIITDNKMPRMCVPKQRISSLARPV